MASQVEHTALHDRLGPHSVGRVGWPFQSVADHDHDIVDPIVADLGQDLSREVRTLATVAGPRAADVSLVIRGEGHRRVDRAVGDLDLALQRCLQHRFHQVT